MLSTKFGGKFSFVFWFFTVVVPLNCVEKTQVETEVFLLYSSSDKINYKDLKSIL